MKNLDDLKEQLQEDASTWYSGLETLDDEIYGCAKIVSDSGPAWNRDDNDVFKLCEMLYAKIDKV